MTLNFEVFCARVVGLKLSHVNTALAVLWFRDIASPEISLTSGELARTMVQSGLGSPHSTRLGQSLLASKLVYKKGKGFALKSLSRGKVKNMLKEALVDQPTEVNQEFGYLPKQVWTNTRGYIERVCEQLNGCYECKFYDAVSVLARRLIETLIIEAYEATHREQEIRDSAGNFFMLSGLATAALSANGIGLGRDAKKALSELKELGDRSAHNRRYNAVKADLDKVQSGVRVITDELLNIASLRKN